MADSCEQDTASRLAPEEALGPWMDVPRDEAAPFVHRFRTARDRYVYDVNTRRIIRVSPVVWDVLGDVGGTDRAGIVARHASSHPRQAVESALDGVAEARREKGLFLSVRPRRVLPPSREEVRRRLADAREQLILNVTEACNFRCTYCVYGGTYAHYRAHSPRAMSWKVARAAIDDFLAHSTRSEGRVISFYGGEPLPALPLIRRCVAHVRKAAGGPPVRFAVTTNGYALAGEAAEFLAGEEFLVVVSLDGPEAVHDRHRRTAGGAPTWRRVTGNVRAFLDAHPDYRTNGRLRFNAVAAPSTDLREVQAFFASCDLFTDAMGLEISEQKQPAGTPARLDPDDPLAVSGRALRARLIDDLKAGLGPDALSDRARWVTSGIFETPLITFHKRGYLAGGLPETMVLRNTCVPGARRTFVGTGGEYYACERVVEAPAAVIGSAADGVDLERVAALLDRWNRLSADQCRLCWCLPTCNVGCFATVGEDGEVTAEAKRLACAACRRNLHQWLIEYCEVLEANPSAFDYAAEVSFK